jgi:uncharacterized protein (DUF433 family)
MPTIGQLIEAIATCATAVGLKRVELVFAKGMGSEQDIAEAEAAVVQAKKDLSAAVDAFDLRDGYSDEPVADLPTVTMDPDVMGGAPCIEGTRIQVATVIGNLRAGKPIDRLFDAYPALPVGGIEAAIRWAEANGVKWRDAEGKG